MDPVLMKILGMVVDNPLANLNDHDAPNDQYRTNCIRSFVAAVEGGDYQTAVNLGSRVREFGAGYLVRLRRVVWTH